jgi:hypothetical protein
MIENIEPAYSTADARTLMAIAERAIAADAADARRRADAGRNVRTNPFISVIDSASRALGYQDVGAEDAPRRVAKPAAASEEISLLDLIADGNPVPDGVYALNMHPTGQTVVLDPRAVIEANSRCAAAGARIVVATPRDSLKLIDGQRTDALYGFRDDAGIVRVVDPAPFAAVADGASATVQAVPVHDASITWSTAPSYAFTTSITRPQNIAVGGGEFLRRNLVESVLRGIGQLADTILLNAIDAATPAAWSGFGAAAARNLEFGNLRALVGTGGFGAAVRQDGTLAVQGIDAELTSSHSKTFVGAFGRAAVMLWADLRIVAKRTSIDGSTSITCFVNALPAVPDAAAFWEVSA